VNLEALRICREALGLTQTDLAKTSGLEQSDLSRWERGLRAPSAPQLAVLAESLRVPIALLMDEATRFTTPVHRTQRAETKRVERMVNGRLELARLAGSRLLADINIDAPFAFPTSEEPAPADPEEAAEAIRRVWRIPPGPLRNLAGSVESAGAIVLPVDFGADNIVAAYADLRGDHRWCFINTRTSDGARARFSLAHELGHAVLHWDRFDAPQGKEAEREAHRFAAALLMPRIEMIQNFGRMRFALDDLVAYRQRWGVSIQALITRARDIGLLSEVQYVRLYKQISARGWRKSEPGRVPIEEPTILGDVLLIHREQHHYSEDELVQIAGLSHGRLVDLLPSHFSPAPGAKPVLSVVR
jgi:Zn-dependent peptidase ImmA (M78 family)/DNA-binding XRE family transcriptional regulator